MLRCEPDNTGFFRSDIGLHQIMLIIHEAIIRLCIGVDLLQGFFVQLIAGVLGDVVVQGGEDLVFQCIGLRWFCYGNCNMNRGLGQEVKAADPTVIRAAGSAASVLMGEEGY